VHFENEEDWWEQQRQRMDDEPGSGGDGEEDYPEYDPPEPTPAFPPDMSIEELAGELPVKHLVSLAMVGTTAKDEDAALAIYQRTREHLAAEIAAGATPGQMAILVGTMSNAAAITFLRGNPRWAEHFRRLGGLAFKPAREVEL
jgi:hypothetical protein